MNLSISSKLLEDFERLNDQQKNIVNKFSKNSMVVAGPGTGKTRTLSVLIAKQLEKGTRLKEILALTFSDKAATELRERVLEYFPQSFDQCWISTFHSFCTRILREQYYEVGITPDFNLLTGFKEAILMSNICGRQQKEAFKEYGKVISKRGFQQEVLTFISLLKSNLIEPEDFKEAIENCPALSLKNKNRCYELLNLFKLYEKERIKAGYLDFRDLIRLSIKALKNPKIAEIYRKKFKIILVDEFQDTDPAQFLLLSLLKGEKADIKTVVIGDPRQSIYRFRGADPSMMTSSGIFQKKYKGKIFPLGKNYRSAKSIVEAATKLKWQSDTEADTLLQPQSEKEGFISFYKLKDELEEARLVGRKIANLIIYGENGKKYKASDIAILVRNNYQIDLISENLQMLHVPYQIAGDMKFFRAEEVLAMASLLKIAAIELKENEAYKNESFECGNSLEKNALEQVLQRAFASLVFKINPLWIQGIFSEISSGKLEMTEVIGFILNKDFDKLPETDKENQNRAFDFAKIVFDLKNACEEKLSVLAVKIVLAVSTLLKKPSDTASHNILLFRNMLADYCEVFRQQHSKEARVKDIAANFDEWLSYYASTVEESQESEEEAVKITTLHQSKGLEFPITVITGLCEGQFPVNIRENLLLGTSTIEKLKEYFNSKSRAVNFFNPYPSNESEQLEEERRLFFVGATRAKEGLILTTPMRLGTDLTEPAPFMKEIGLKAVNEEKGNRILTLGEFRTALTSLNQEEMLELEPTLVEIEKIIPKEYAIHGIRPRVFNKAKHDAIELPKDFCFSATSLKNYIDCPRKFFFSNLLGIRNPLEENKPHFALGNACHKVLEELHKPGSIWESGKKPSDEELFDLFERHGMPILDVVPFFERYRSAESIKNALLIYRDALYEFEQIIPRRTKEVEAKFSFKIADSLVVGRFDRIALIDEESVQIIDYKTSKSNILTSEKIFERAFPTSNSLEDQLELQMPIYLLACQNLGFKKLSAALFYVMSDCYKKKYNSMQKGYQKSAALNLGCGPRYGKEIAEEELEAFKQRLTDLITKIKTDRVFESSPSKNDEAKTCHKKDGCEFATFCQVGREISREKAEREASYYG